MHTRGQRGATRRQRSAATARNDELYIIVAPGDAARSTGTSSVSGLSSPLFAGQWQGTGESQRAWNFAQLCGPRWPGIWVLSVGCFFFFFETLARFDPLSPLASPPPSPPLDGMPRHRAPPLLGACNYFARVYAGALRGRVARYKSNAVGHAANRRLAESRPTCVCPRPGASVLPGKRDLRLNEFFIYAN